MTKEQLQEKIEKAKNNKHLSPEMLEHYIAKIEKEIEGLDKKRTVHYRGGDTQIVSKGDEVMAINKNGEVLKQYVATNNKEIKSLSKQLAYEHNIDLDGNKKEKNSTDLANELMQIDSDVFDELDIRSGSQLYSDIDLQKKYKKVLDKKIPKKIFSTEVHDLIEDDNYHSLNQYLYLSGKFGKKEQTKWIEFLDKLKPESRVNFLSKDVFSSDKKDKQLYVAVGEKDGYWTILSKPTTYNKAKLMTDSVLKGESGRVVTLEEAQTHKKVIGKEYLVEKKGEDKIIGHTQSGMPVYNLFTNESHKDFSEQDHRDAYKITQEIANASPKKWTIKDKENMEHYHAESKKYLQAAKEKEQEKIINEVKLKRKRKTDKDEDVY